MEVSGASENKLALIYGTPIMVVAIKHFCTKYQVDKNMLGVGHLKSSRFKFSQNE